jgi:ABC-type sugar transport system substrate-binding protein
VIRSVLMVAAILGLAPGAGRADADNPIVWENALPGSPWWEIGRNGHRHPACGRVVRSPGW